MSDCQVNVKEEKVDDQKNKSRREVSKSNQRSEDPAVVQLNVSLDSYLPPGPRQPDTLAMASQRFDGNVLEEEYSLVLLGVKVRSTNLNLEP